MMTPKKIHISDKSYVFYQFLCLKKQTIYLSESYLYLQQKMLWFPLHSPQFLLSVKSSIHTKALQLRVKEKINY